MVRGVGTPVSRYPYAYVANPLPTSAPVSVEIGGGFTVRAMLSAFTPG